jgi:predicted component of type VI protein secretion system
MKTISVGRAPENDIIVEDALVSGKHLQITRDATGYFVEDLNSTNGTWVDGRLLRGGRQVMTLSSNIKVGETILVWHHYFIEPTPPLPESYQTTPLPTLPPVQPATHLPINSILFWSFVSISGLLLVLLLIWYFNFVQKP